MSQPVTVDVDGETFTLQRVDDTHDGQPRYDVLDADGNRLGRVYRCSITVERKPTGLRYVTSRRESKPRYWKIDVPGRRTYGIDYDTRKRAVAEVVWAVRRDG
jgi:hypothetical protein